MSNTILIRNGRLIDPATKTDEICDLLLADGVVAARGKDLKKKAARTIDATGLLVMPGLIDMHVHLRDPGQTKKETITSGARAAARGGFTTIVAMPNTKPVIDSADRVDFVNNKAAQMASIRVLQAGAVTKGQKGESLSDIAEMVAHGAIAISEDGSSVMNAKLCLEALREAASLGIPFLDHCEDKTLVAGGCVNDDEYAKQEGLPGISNETEDVIIARDLMLARAAGAHLHLCHCSTAGSYHILKLAKAQGFDASGEVTPHHFTLTSADRIPGDSNYKMNPPLRTEADRQALIKGLKEGVFEVIATDHAPHTAEDKRGSMQQAAFGIVGLETAVCLAYTELVESGILSPLQMVEKMSTNPARILGLADRGSLDVGKLADVTIIDPVDHFQIEAYRFLSKGRNTPFDRREAKGRIMFTICGGQPVHISSFASKRIK